MRTAGWRAALMAVLMLAPGGPAAACALTIGWEPWPPYQIAGDDGPEGLDIELVRLIAERADCAVTFRQMPWARLLRSIEHGSVDGAMAATVTEDRKAWGRFTAPYRSETVGLMVRRGAASLADKESLRAILESGHTVGLWRDYYYGETVETLQADPALSAGFHVLDQGATLLRMLVRGRFDAVLGDPVAASYTARKLGVADRVTVHHLVLLKTPVHLLLSRESVAPETVARLDAAIAGATEDGALAAILARYIGT